MARVVSGHSSEVLQVGPLQIRPDAYLAWVNGQALTLSRRELDLLVELARRADRIVSREELFRLVWGRELPAHDRSVDVYVRKLRVKLNGALPGWQFIHTHFGFGYRLAADREQLSHSGTVNSFATPGSQLGNTRAPGSAETEGNQDEGDNRE